MDIEHSGLAPSPGTGGFMKGVADSNTSARSGLDSPETKKKKGGLKRSADVALTPESTVSVKSPKKIEDSTPSKSVFSALQKQDQLNIQSLYDSSSSFKQHVSQLAPMVRVGLGEGGKGTQGVVIGEDGTFGEPNDVSNPRSNDDLKRSARGFGTQMRERFVKMSPEDRKADIKQMRSLGAQLETMAKDAGVFKDPEGYSDMLSSFEGKKFTGSQFRDIEKGLDEQTQSAITTAFHEGFRKPGEKEDGKQKRHADKFEMAFLKAQSALRLSTEHTVAPVISKDVTREADDDHSSSYTENVLFGHQHITSHDTPLIERGVGVSPLSHRDRAQGWVEALSEAIPVTKGVFVPLATTLTAASVGTTKSMSHPLSGVKGADEYFSDSFIKQQTTTREMSKQQGNLSAQSSGLRIDSGTQPFNAPKQATKYPSSPLRISPHETD
ncbi:MAG TPA: hypothetical protein VLC08_08130 [Chitinolyticbacter sp.]|nr:hypothetical protein [Chitinolyticbacter sp.]